MKYLPVATLILGVISIWLTAGQFYVTNSQKNKEPFLRTQLEFLIEASDTVAALAIESDPIKWEESRKAFWKLYWGRLAIVEDPSVKYWMICVGKKVPPSKSAVADIPIGVLQFSSLQLAYAARDLALDSWNIELPELQIGAEGMTRQTKSCPFDDS